MQARLDVMLIDDNERVVAVRTGVPLSEAFSIGQEFLRTRGAVASRVTIDGTDVTPMLLRNTSPAPAREPQNVAPASVTSAWQFLLTDDHVLHRIRIANDGAGDPELRAGAGPGGLQWHPIEDHSMKGLAAAWRCGTFKILRLSSGHCALLHERASDLEALALGEPNALKERAGARVNVGPPRVVLDPERLRIVFKHRLIREK